MNKNDEFYVGYLDEVGPTTRKKLKRFVIIALLFIVVGASVFALTQKPFDNSTFELTSETKITGVYHEMPYPMLRVDLGNGIYKNILLLGFGKLSVNPYLEEIRSEVGNISNKTVTIEGNLIYYNGKTLLQITSSEKIHLEDVKDTPINSEKGMGAMTFEGEIIDPKCYFGVMKPGKGKIHRSCAIRCISGGIPPVLATSDNNDIATYFLLTDLDGEPINESILEHIGKPSKISGEVERLDDWHILKIDPSSIIANGKTSVIY